MLYFNHSKGAILKLKHNRKEVININSGYNHGHNYKGYIIKHYKDHCKVITPNGDYWESRSEREAIDDINEDIKKQLKDNEQ